jgi:hypothetical protein
MKKILLAPILLLLFAPLFFPAISYAQSGDSSSLTITPPFFELNVNPGDSWSSSIRVINTNGSDMQVRVMVMGFTASDDMGHGNFVPLSQLAGDDDALANWITTSGSSVNVPRDGAVDVPFSISVPSNASPGGHYGAILIGTGAPSAQTSTSQVGVSSFISALIFVRVAGDVTESAHIQSFSTDKNSYQTPDVHFAVKVQNAGDVHIRPVGMIQIYNAFGKERGEISINGTGTLGYVLPSSSREFDAEWQGQPSLWDIGPYTAVLSLAYGENGTKSVTQTIGFWILPIYQLFEIGLSILVSVMIFMYILRRAVRKLLTKEMAKYSGVPAPHESKATSRSDEDVLDLRGSKKK